MKLDDITIVFVVSFGMRHCRALTGEKAEHEPRKNGRSSAQDERSLILFPKRKLTRASKTTQHSTRSGEIGRGSVLHQGRKKEVAAELNPPALKGN